MAAQEHRGQRPEGILVICGREPGRKKAGGAVSKDAAPGVGVWRFGSDLCREMGREPFPSLREAARGGDVLGRRRWHPAPRGTDHQSPQEGEILGWEVRGGSRMAPWMQTEVQEQRRACRDTLLGTCPRAGSACRWRSV